MKKFDPNNFTFEKGSDLSAISGPRNELFVVSTVKYKMFPLVFFERKALIVHSESAQFVDLIRFGLSNMERFIEYFIIPEINTYNKYFVFICNPEDYVDLSNYQKCWTESSVAYFCKEILKALMFLNENELCYGFLGFNECMTRSGQIKLNFHMVLEESHLVFSRQSGFGNLLFTAPDRVQHAINTHASIESDIYGLGIQSLLFLENSAPEMYTQNPSPLQYLMRISNKNGVMALRQATNVKPETRDFVASAAHLESTLRGTLAELSNHEFLKLADTEEEFKAYFVPLLTQAKPSGYN